MNKVALILMSFVVAPAVAAQGGDADRYFTLMGSQMWPSDVREVDTDNLGIQAIFGMPMPGYEHWDVEIGARVQRVTADTTEEDDDLYYLGLDLRRHWHVGMPFTPFVLAGAGLAYETVDGNDKVHPGFGIGAGAMVPLGYRNLSLRIEARAIAQQNDYERNGQPVSGRYLFVDGYGSLGLSYAFGDAPAAPAKPDDCDLAVVGADGRGGDCVADSDSDGVADDEDLCPGTSPGATVDSLGCLRFAYARDGSAQVGDSLILKGVNFETGTAKLTVPARAILDEVAATLVGPLAGRSIEIGGHTDNQGSPEYNYDLSQRRADAVKAYLVSKGVDAGLLTTEGYGFDQPIANNDTPAGRSSNRRVEFTVLAPS